MRNVITLVLGGGKGTRLYPLTKFRSKPAVPLAGKYRLIDIPISNCLNSGLNRIYLLTQFNSVSLHRHIRDTYNFDSFHRGFVEILAAQQTFAGTDWYEGTADAVRKNIQVIEQPGIENVLILSGDQLYRQNYLEMLATHRSSGADVTISAVPVTPEQASGFGIMRCDKSGRVEGFLEKPQTEEELDLVRTDPAWIDSFGIKSRGRNCLASMGIYVFKRDTLLDVLTKTDYQDFGKEIFPAALRTRKVQVHLFDGYWEDIGTIKAFYDANLDLCKPNPAFQLVSADAPIYSRPRFLSPTLIDGATVKHSLIADGGSIGEGSVIENSVIGLRCRIGKNVTIRNSIIMGADFYQTAADLAADKAARRPTVGIGDNVVIDGAIVDKNCRVGAGSKIINLSKVQDSPETAEGMVCDGIVVIPKDSTLPEGWQLRL
jgi:glucose-1-phosphate adenylyltransferase